MERGLTQSKKTVDLILKEYPTDKSREHLLYEAHITQDLMTKLVAPRYMRMDRWQHIADTYLETGMLTETPDLEGFVFEDLPQ